MARWIHRLSDIDPEARTAVCAEDGPVSIVWHQRWKCSIARRAQRGGRSPASKSAGYRRYYLAHREQKGAAEAVRRRLGRRRGLVGMVCMDCGLEADNPSFLDVHHVNGHHRDNSPGNRVTICPNCHRRRHLAEPGLSR